MEYVAKQVVSSKISSAKEDILGKEDDAQSSGARAKALKEERARAKAEDEKRAAIQAKRR
jgi:hypothetical protein